MLDENASIVISVIFLTIELFSLYIAYFINKSRAFNGIEQKCPLTFKQHHKMEAFLQNIMNEDLLKLSMIDLYEQEEEEENSPKETSINQGQLKKKQPPPRKYMNNLYK